jgi:hypothetical protein
LSGAPDAENSLANPTHVVPTLDTFVAGSVFDFRFPAYSITVLRVGCSG